jgi:serine/threonine protein kinase
LNIINKLNELNRCFKYFNIKDFYGTFNGKKIKMGNIYSLSIYDEKGEMTFGPDILKILLLLDKLPTGDENEVTFDMVENIFKNDAYIPPEIIKQINWENPSYKTDSWLYGVLLYNLIFGITPESFYSQLKKYCETFYGNYSMEQIIYYSL